MQQQEPEAAPAGALSPDELSAEQATDLPDREAMSVFGQFPSSLENFAMPINTAEAANFYSTSSVAAADADQIVILDQGINVTGDDFNDPNVTGDDFGQTDGKRVK